MSLSQADIRKAADNLALPLVATSLVDSIAGGAPHNTYTCYLDGVASISLPSAQVGARYSFLRKNKTWPLRVQPIGADIIADAEVDAYLELTAAETYVTVSCNVAGFWLLQAHEGETRFEIGAGRTYYMATTGSDSNPGTSSLPRLTMKSAAKLLAPGDKLIVKDGTYAAASNDFTNDITDGAMPRGKKGRWITVQAENRGAAIFTSSVKFIVAEAEEPVEHFLKLDGFIFNKEEAKRFNVSRLKAMNCGFRGAALTGNSTTVNVGGGNFENIGAENVLFEDCWAWGPGGRYRFMAFNSRKVIFRRCVARWDQGWNGANFNSSDFVIYDSRQCRVQNCISIDSLRPSTNPENYLAAFRVEANYSSVVDVTFSGCIGVNNQSSMFNTNGLSKSSIGSPAIDAQRMQRGVGITVEHCAGALIGSTDSPNGFESYRGLDVTFLNCTIAHLKQNGVAFLGDSNVRNSAATRFINPLTILNGTGSANSGGVVTNALTYATLALAKTNGGWYLPSPKYFTATPPADTIYWSWAGAHILFRIGRSGTLFDDPEMDAYGDGTSAGNSLWPFPNEALIKTTMSAAGGFGDVNRDWTAGASTLTQYIWGILGNAGPPADLN